MPRPHLYLGNAYKDAALSASDSTQAMALRGQASASYKSVIRTFQEGKNPEHLDLVRISVKEATCFGFKVATPPLLAIVQDRADAGRLGRRVLRARQGALSAITADLAGIRRGSEGALVQQLEKVVQAGTDQRAIDC